MILKIKKIMTNSKSNKNSKIINRQNRIHLKKYKEAILNQN